jgi:hypothetical protein
VNTTTTTNNNNWENGKQQRCPTGSQKKYIVAQVPAVLVVTGNVEESINLLTMKMTKAMMMRVLL